MGFHGYRLRHKIAIFESVKDIPSDNSSSDMLNVRNIEMNLFIYSDSTRFYRFDEMESKISEILKRFSERPIEEIPPFKMIEPTLENIGNLFYELLGKGFEDIGAPLERLEVSENLVRTFVVTKASSKDSLIVDGKKTKIAHLLMADYITQSINRLVAEQENPSSPEKAGDLDIIKPLDISVEPEEEAIAEAPVTSTDSLSVIERSQPAIEVDNVSIKHQSRPNTIQIAFAISVLMLTGAAMAVYIYNRGLYPAGVDIYGHLFKADLLYNCINKGDYYPLHTDLWYNGVQPFRYWAPLPYYILALLQFPAGGDILISYLFFIALSIIVGGMGWILWGIYYNRLFLCTFFAVIWFFLPDNMRVFFVEGNLPRMAIAIFLPYLFFFIWRFTEHRKKSAALPIIILMCAIIMCHVMIAAMIGITTFVFLTIYSVTKGRFTESFYAITLMLFSFALCAPWLYPALQGGLVSMDASATAEVMRALSTPASLSLNPFLRNQGLHELFYFGISILALSIFGLVFSGKKSKPGFLTAILVFIGTLPIMVPFLDKLPLNQLLWMTRFTPIVYAIFILSIIEWKKLKRYAILILAIILILDSAPSLDFYRYYSLVPNVFSYTIDDAKDITAQRISLMDLSTYGSYPSFGVSSEEPKTPYAYGWAWQGASTAYNIMMMNSSLERGYYTYLFDRNLEMGNDTVLVQKQQVELAKQTRSSLLEGAAESNYNLAKETNETYIFKRQTPDTFGTIADYKGLTIGRSANLIALEYPVFEEGLENDVAKYTLEELKDYDAIYLSGFTYADKEAAEELLSQAAISGVKIIIDMNRIPADTVTNRMSFLGVNAQPVSFKDRFPEMIYKEGVYDSLPFNESFKTWNTVYLENLDEITAYSWVEGKLLPFVGSKSHENIIFLGYNFLFHALETQDDAVIGFISDITGFQQDVLPDRKVVPLSISYEKNKIIIDSPEDNVNTSLGFQDIFRSDEELEKQTNLLVVGRGTTEINMVYPYLKEGMIVGFLGVGIITIILIIINKGGKKHEKEV